MKSIPGTDTPSVGVQAAPLYSQLTKAFRDLILQKDWPVGAVLPSESELARRYGVSVGTTRKALEALEAGGWITRKQGRGTFVTHPNGQQPERADYMVARGDGRKILDSGAYTVLRSEVERATADEAGALKIREGVEVIHLERRLDAFGKPALVEHYILRRDLCTAIETRTNLPKNLNGMFREIGIALQTCTTHLTAVPATTELAALLSVAAATPLLHSRQQLVDVDGVVIGMLDRWMVTSNIEYVIAAA